MNDTKSKILDATERLIAEHGPEVSLRTITAEAGVNLAAINYHFQSKDALIDAVVARRVEPVNRARVEMLESLEREYPSGPLPLEGVLEAFLEPVFEFHGDDHIRVLLGRLYSVPDEFLKRVFAKHLSPIADRFAAAFARALPDLPAQDRMWCMLLTVGAMVHMMTFSRMLAVLSHEQVSAADPKETSRRIVNFAAAGFRAALENAKKQREGTLHA